MKPADRVEWAASKTRLRSFRFAVPLLERVRHLLAKALEVGAAQRHGLELGIVHRVDRLAVAQEFEMHVRAGRPAGAADEADHLAARHCRAQLEAGRKGREMA